MISPVESQTYIIFKECFKLSVFRIDRGYFRGVFLHNVLIVFASIVLFRLISYFEIRLFSVMCFADASSGV